jgi:hypothetical protein
MNRKSLIFTLVASALCITCAGAADRDKSDELTIQLSPEAAKAAKRKDQLALYRKAVAGETKAGEEWFALPAPTRTSLLSELAMSKESGAARNRALRDLTRLSPSEDPEGLALKALARAAVVEGDGSLRNLARKGLAARADERVPNWLVQVVEHSDGLTRANAVETLKAIGGPRVYEVIIDHWKETWGAGPRAHVFFGNMRSYVADYDISGDAYDPVIKTMFTGVCLDAKSLRLEGDIYVVTIREITADDPKLSADPAAWEQWLRKERANIAKAGEEKQKAAAADLAGMKNE